MGNSFSKESFNDKFDFTEIYRYLYFENHFSNLETKEDYYEELQKIDNMIGGFYKYKVCNDIHNYAKTCQYMKSTSNVIPNNIESQFSKLISDLKTLALIMRNTKLHQTNQIIKRLYENTEIINKISDTYDEELVKQLPLFNMTTSEYNDFVNLAKTDYVTFIKKYFNSIYNAIGVNKNSYNRNNVYDIQREKQKVISSINEAAKNLGITIETFSFSDSQDNESDLYRFSKAYYIARH